MRSTRIPLVVLGGAPLSQFEAEEKIFWALNRETTRTEDMAYALLGILDLYLPLIYGEGMLNAFKRLHWELDRRAKDTEKAFERNPILNPHPVKTNYRKVFVTIIFWECDQLLETVGNISKIFRNIYNYEVREMLLTLEDQYRDDPNFPWYEPSLVQENDLQIIHYLGSTRRVSDPHDWVDIQAFPFRRSSQDHDQISSHYNWLKTAIGIPHNFSDVLMILDCYASALLGSAQEAPITFLDFGSPWTRFALIAAGYPTDESEPGLFSNRFMAVLEDLAESRETVNLALVTRKFDENQNAGAKDIQPWRSGTNGCSTIILSPIQE